MNKIISFGLWGNDPKYCVGAVKNARLALEIYPGWTCRFFLAQSVPPKYSREIESIENTEIVHKDEVKGDWTSAFWRYSTCWDNSVDVSIFRDADSRLNIREKEAVDEWISTDKTFHIMRDHPFHQFHILGGMWGYKKNNKYDMKSIFDQFSPTDSYWTEYKFFRTILFPIIGEDKITHDEFFEKQSFPSKRIGQHFVGEVYDENDNRNEEHYRYIKT